MIQYRKIMAAILLSGTVLALAACSSNNSGTVASSDNAVPSEPASSQPAVSASPTPQPTPASETPSAPQTADSAAVKQVKELLDLAKKGKVPGVPFVSHTSLIDDVKKAWGDPDKEEAAGKGFYATYTDKNAVFGYNKGSQIFDVRSSSPDLQTLTLDDIKAALGDPAGVTKNGTDEIYIYNANKQYQLKFIIPASTGKVDHISVFSPADSVNNMAG